MDRTEASELLGTVGRVSRDVRRARHGYWFPLVLFGLIILGALPFYRYHLGSYGGDPGSLGNLGLGAGDGNHPWGAALFWLISVPLGYVAVAVYYAQRARRTGVQGPIRSYVVTGLALFALLIATAPGIVQLLHAPRWAVDWRPYQLFGRGFTPILVVSLGFFVLARLERSWAMLTIACAFLAVALLANLYNISNAFYRIHHWIVPDWAANLAVAGGFLVFVGLISLAAQRRGARHA